VVPGGGLCPAVHLSAEWLPWLVRIDGLRDFLFSGARFSGSLFSGERSQGIVTGHNGGVRRRPARLSLAARLALAWSLGAGIVTGLVGGSSYFLVRDFLITQRQNEIQIQGLRNAGSVLQSLRQRNSDPERALGQAQTEAEALTFLRYLDRGVVPTEPAFRWKGDRTASKVLPPAFIDHLVSGKPGVQRIEVGDSGEVWMAVGVPMPSVASTYVEVVPLTRLTSTLTNLRNSVIAGMIGALSVGAVLGAWTARRVLRPVAQVAEAAEALAEGALETRLQAEGDPDLNRVAASFNTMVDAVRGRIEREERFASDVSHELRTPLGVMSAAAQVLDRRKGEMPDRAAQAVDVITGQLNKLSTMVLDLLEIARIDAGVADVHLEPCEVVALTRRIVEGQGVSQDIVVVEDSAKDASALLDPRRYEQIVRNLLDNARKYGGGATAVVVRADARYVHVSVEDSGPGVPAVERERVFERFARGRSTHDVPGTGLGLALAADQAALLNAELSVADRVGGGAVFRIKLVRDRDGASRAGSQKLPDRVRKARR
jgi:two-component system, OmpR family, sensor histidine kinase MtrB